jgi:glycosyltransferase involved in cell wall biosynthesis
VPNPNPRVAVIIPCSKDHWRYLPECLASLDAQTFQNFSVVIVSGLTLVQARNAALDSICNERPKYWLPLDADDTIEPRCLEVLSDLLDQNPQAEAASPNSEHTLGPGIMENNYLPYCSMFRRIGFSYYHQPHPTIQGMEDWDYWIYLYRLGEQTVSTPEHLFNWKRRPGSMSAEFEGKPLYNEIKQAMLARYK